MKYQPYVEFTAQGANVRTLMTMYASLDTAPDTVERVIPIVVFVAFSIEAYLNSVGSRCVPFWDELERLPWRSKVNILHKSAGQKANWGEAHLQFATSVFKLRDNLIVKGTDLFFSRSFSNITVPFFVFFLAILTHPNRC